MNEDPFAVSLHPLFHGLREGQLWRRRELRTSAVAPRIELGGEGFLSFSSNDYLGLANDPRVVDAFCRGARRYGVGASASHLLGGHTQAHHELEEALADFAGTPRALLFSTGYMANLALLTVLSGRHKKVFEDRRNHASLLDAAGLAQADRRRYRDPDELASLIQEASPGALIVTDGVFSMDGDIAPLPLLWAHAQDRGLGLIVDDAHAFGVLGPEGRGTVAFHGLAHHPGLVQMGTLGKALGVFGAFVAGSEDLIEALIQRARPYIYTTAVPPALAVATIASLGLVRTEEYRRTQLHARIREFRDGAQERHIPLALSYTAIQPVIVGSAHRALEVSRALRSRGLFVAAVRPPTVPQGSARLRVALSAAHSTVDIERLLDGLAAELAAFV